MARHTYSLLKHNCNNFTSEASQFLTGKDIPEYITGLPDDALSKPAAEPIRRMIERKHELIKQQELSEGIFWQGSDLRLPPIRNSKINSFNNQQNNQFRQEEPILNSGESKEEIPNIKKIQITHPHESLNLSVIRSNNSPFLTKDNKYKIFYEMIETISSKMKINHDDRLKSLALTSEEHSILKKSMEICIKGTSDKVPEEIFLLFDRLVNDWKPVYMFSVLGFLRLLILRPEGSAYYSNKDIKYFDPIIKFIPSLDEEKHDRKKNIDIPNTVQVMALCTICNLFVNSSMAKRLTKEPKIIKMANSALFSEEKIVHLMGATLLYNCSLYMPKDDSISVINSINLLLGVIKSDMHLESCYRSLLALGQLVFQNSSCTLMLTDLSLPYSMMKKDDELEKINTLYNDLQLILSYEKEHKK